MEFSFFTLSLDLFLLTIGNISFSLSLLNFHRLNNRRKIKGLTDLLHLFAKSPLSVIEKHYDSETNKMESYVHVWSVRVCVL